MLDVILERLDKVKKQGDQYYAKCPVHMGGKQNLGITEKDGKIIMHCFACNAKGVEVCDAIGLPVHVLFKDDPTFSNKNYLSQNKQDQVLEDGFFMAIYDAEVEQGHKPTIEEYRRYKLCKQRVKILDSSIP